MNLLIGTLTLLSVLSTSPAIAGDAAPAPKPYKRHQIAVARFGEGDRQKLLKQAYQIQQNIDRQIVGQERVTKALQDRVVQYIESYGTRDKDPIAMHLIGLPGIGKSVMLDELTKLGFNVVRFDSQSYVDTGAFRSQNFANDLFSKMAANTGKPTIILIDELDKLPEIVPGKEESSSFIGSLNELLTDGKVLSQFVPTGLDLSNVMVITTMNFSPEEIERFSQDALKNDKKYYDYTVEDFAAFDKWITSNPSARYKVLSHLFRSNTVSRLAPNTVVMKPLTADDYKKIVRINIEKAVARMMSGANAAKRLEITFTDAFVDYVYSKVVFAPSGARETVYKTDALTEQLINFASKSAVDDAQKASLDRPRRVKLDADLTADKATATIAPLKRLPGGEIVEQDSFKLETTFDGNSRLFVQPTTIVSEAPKSAAMPKPADPNAPVHVSKKQILANRFPENQKAAEGLAEKIDKEILGQGLFTKLIEREFNNYLGRPEPAVKQPPSLLFAGFPGIGKSELVNLTGKYLDLPIARINMQAFSSDSAESYSNFMTTLSNEVNSARQKSKNGKFIVLFEELDKVFEINPQSGAFVNRPIMAAIKDLLNDGVVQMPSTPNSGWSGVGIDIRSAFMMGTMNFAVDRFGFEADPRLTSIEDVQNAWHRLNARMADLKKVLGTMFLPETVSRLIPRTFVIKPLEQKDYETLIQNQVDAVARERLLDKKGVNRGQIVLEASPAYLQYLYNETVVPSEGARNTVIASRNRIATDLDMALKGLPKDHALAAAPIKIRLDFDPATTMVSAIATATQPTPKTSEPLQLLNHQVALNFPPLGSTGALPAERVRVAVHEFGHAYTAVRLGRRIEYATVIPPKQGVGGYVKYKDSSQSAKAILAGIYSALGSTAMERIFLSDDPTNDKSVLDITAGPSNDILQATKRLWLMLYETGMDPKGGTVERMGVDGGMRYASFSDLSPEDVQKLGLVLRDMVNVVIGDLLKAHDREWYRQKILSFGRAGGMTEEEFFKMIGYTYAGPNSEFLGEESAVLKEFGKDVIQTAPEVKTAADFKQGNTKTTARENMNSFTDAFAGILASRLHGDGAVIKAKLEAATNVCENLLTAP